MFRRIGMMIGSPGDAFEERQAITEAIQRWNATNSFDNHIMLEPVKWETHATPGLKGRPQGMINEELIPKSDCLIAVFRARAGSHTGKEISGTIEEIREFMRGGKYVTIYFYEGLVSLGSIDPDQIKAINEFKKEIQKQGLIESYETVPELSAKLANHLTAIVRAVVAALPETDGDEQVSSSPTAMPMRIAKPQPSASPTAEPSTIVVNDSGSWTLLDTQFYESQSVRQTGDGHWVAEIRSKSAEDDAHFSGLHPHHFGRSRPIPFAHRNNAFLVTVKNVESFSQNGHQIWTLTLKPEDIEYGGSVMDVTWHSEGKIYKPEDIARLRAGRILLNDPPPMKDSDRPFSHDQMNEIMLETYIRGSSNPASVEHCIIQVIHRSIGGDPNKFLALARLASIYFLRASGVVEAILELTLGPIINNCVHVKFKGRRRQIASNVEAAVISLEGYCQLD